jgi:hypothetical protein
MGGAEAAVKSRDLGSNSEGIQARSRRIQIEKRRPKLFTVVRSALNPLLDNE